MKIAFSTLGCPDFGWTDIYSMAKDFGFDGIEIRGLGKEIFAVKAPPFTESQLPATVEQLARLDLEIPCLSSGCCLKFPEQAEANYRELVEYIALAGKLGTPYVRILADQDPHPKDEVDDAVVLAALRRLVPVAEAKGVTLLVETNGVYADTRRLCNLLNQVGSDAVGALWDLHHPYRFAGEKPETTVQNLGAYIKYVHIKDSVVEDGVVKYKMMGEGDLPIDGMMQALHSINYEGYITLEWVKRWAPELNDAGVVFPHYANFMQRYLKKQVVRGRLFDNRTKTGKYVWEKDTLIDLTFPQVLDRMVEEFPNQYAFRYTTMDYTRTYAEFREDVDTFARALIALGVKPGDHVAIWATNVPQWFITFWATTKIGAVLVTVNTAYKIHEAEYLLRQSDTHTLVMIDGYKDSNYVAIMRELCPELATTEPGRPLFAKRLPFLRHIITIDSKQPGCLTWEEALALAERVPRAEVERRALAVSRHDVCNIQYTSGTTGFPKGVMLTHYSVVNNGKCIGDCMDLSTADRLLLHVPMFHCFGMVLAMTAAMTHGATLVPLPSFSPKQSLAAINQEKITCCHGVPTMFIAMLGHEDFAKTDFSHMRTGIMAGSPCPVKVMQDVVEKMNMREITIVYGQTEASPGCTQSRVDDPIELRVNTVGRPLPGVECKIVDPQTGADLPDGVEGEFVVRGYNVMKGYYKMPEATAAVIDENGWLHTGDLASRDANGYFRITGRIKDMIIRGGENIYPKEIEDFIYTHPKVKDVQVIGVPDKDYGEEIMACVILKEGMEMTADELKDYVRSHLAKHKTPRYVEFVKEFPMNAAGKILKYKLREEAREKLGLSAR
ncbi:AMP-binding protein [Capillibacterium thermochitinicola]|uniref:AMP-binding protein n=1 Tax=Capillibacterium thermochitinicola TaxID=2699427 RepID=A0A8J6LLV1_9FIRM|nr:AMP-binding protein [Capillibacterium thermochitinicola]MBA2132483.1 AMP-binding protein [Capillibacterium thermochitinicola]